VTRTTFRFQATWLAAAAVALAWHGVAGPHLFDVGELVAAAWTLGGSHPPGQPLHALLGHMALLLPLGPMEWRMTLLSVAGAVLAAGLTGHLAVTLLRGLGATGSRALHTALAGAAALAVLLSPPLLRQAVRPEVYAPALAMTVAAFGLLWQWGRRGPQAGARLRWAALLAGLVTALHPPHGVAILVVALVVLATLRRDVLRRPRAVVGAVTFGLLGLLAHLYLPVRGRAGAPMWGDPTTLAGLGDYLTARAYRMNLGAAAEPAAGLADIVAYAARACGVLPLLGLLWLAWRVVRRDVPRAPGFAILLAAPVALLAAGLQPLEERNPDNVAYYGPAVALLIAGGVMGLGLWLGGPTRGASPTAGGPRRTAVNAPALAGMALLVAVAVHPLALPQVPTVVRANAPALETLGALLTHTPPPRALVVVETDLVATTWWAAQHAEGARPDVALLATGLATSSWHWRSLAAHPAFDGAPVRGAGPSARAAYVNGAVRTALGAGVPVATEPAHPVGGQGAVTGPYLLVHDGVERSRMQGTMAERSWPSLDAEVASSPEGDHAAIGNVLRAQQVDRAVRVLERRDHPEAFASLARALHFAPAPLRQRVAAAGPLQRAASPAVRDPRAFMVSRGDLVREAARWAFAAGDAETAFGLLQWQGEGGDPRALLQLAWLHAAGGHAGAAREALDAFRHEAPSLVDEAAVLAHHLAQAAPP
jgi:hypothetical protein